MSAIIDSPFKTEALNGSVALITGGGSGICFEIAHQLGLHGCKVMIMGRREKFLREAVLNLQSFGIEASYVAGDVRSRDDAVRAVDAAFQTFGNQRLDILVNGAAGNFLACPEDLSLNGFKTVLNIDTVGTFNMSTAAFPYLKKTAEMMNSQRSNMGSAPTFTTQIINISMTLHLGATWYQAHASAAKAAIDSLTRSLALEWGQYNIRVNGLAPGPIANTPGMAKLAPAQATAGAGGNPTKPKSISNGISSSSSNSSDSSMLGVPLGPDRMGTTTEIGLVAVFLCSRAGGYISGDVLLVDGGSWLMKPPMIPRHLVKSFAKKAEKKSRALKPPADNDSTQQKSKL